MNEYEQKANKFLKDTNTEFKAVFLKNGLYFDDDKEPRDIYKTTLKRGEREYKFKFGQSIADKGKKPSAYDVLSCLTKYDTGDFKEFCDSFGYDEDSRKAEKTYNAVVEEWKNIQILYNEEEIEKLQEIQ